MGQEELMNKIAELEREIAILPEGSITKKRIRDKEYYYHRITINGKRTENYLDFEEVPEQYRHIANEEKCAMTSHRYGDITGRYVIYRGDSTEVDGVQYLNVEEYLKSL